MAGELLLASVDIDDDEESSAKSVCCIQCGPGRCMNLMEPAAYQFSETLFRKIVHFNFPNKYDDGLPRLPLLKFDGQSESSKLFMLSTYLKNPVLPTFWQCDCTDPEIVAGSIVSPAILLGVRALVPPSQAKEEFFELGMRITVTLIDYDPVGAGMGSQVLEKKILPQTYGSASLQNHRLSKEFRRL